MVTVWYHMSSARLLGTSVDIASSPVISYPASVPAGILSAAYNIENTLPSPPTHSLLGTYLPKGSQTSTIPPPAAAAAIMWLIEIHMNSVHSSTQGAIS